MFIIVIDYGDIFPKLSIKISDKQKYTHMHKHVFKTYFKSKSDVRHLQSEN